MKVIRIVEHVGNDEQMKMQLSASMNDGKYEFAALTRCETLPKPNLWGVRRVYPIRQDEKATEVMNQVWTTERGAQNAADEHRAAEIRKMFPDGPFPDPLWWQRDKTGITFASDEPEQTTWFVFRVGLNMEGDK